MKNKLWTEFYRPKNVNEYVFVEEEQKQKVLHWINQGSIPHLLFCGEAGTGKTSLAKVLINELDINEYDLLEINASRENGVDVIREKIVNFVETVPFGDFKVVLLDECDYMTQNGQAMLRNDMETYHENVRFILTCNYPHKIIPALKSRCQTFYISKPDINEFTTRVATILINENVEFDLETLDTYVRTTYPDLRKCLNQLQSNSITGKLTINSDSQVSDESVFVNSINLFKQNKIYEARKELLQYLSMNQNKIEDIYKFLYENLDLWGDTDEKKDNAIIIIRNGLANLSLVGIPEISLAATLCELKSI